VKLRLTARVDSVGVIDEPFGIEVPPYVVDLGCEKRNQIVEIRVEKQVDVSSVSLPSTTIAEGRRLEFRISTTDPHFEDVLDLVQFIESIGSFHLGIRRIHWQQAKYEWIPESDQERQKLSLFSVQTKHEYPETPVPVDPGTLLRLLRSRTRLERYKIPMAFFREGVNDYRAFRYVNAFHNFYFFLEDLFGEGRTKNKQVEEKFAANSDLIGAAQRSISELMASNHTRHRENVSAFMSDKENDWTTDGIFSFLVHMRGNLHHFSQKSSKPKGHPLNQLEYESVAYLIQMISYHVVVAIVR
jgi:hypothetical protein